MIQPPPAQPGMRESEVETPALLLDLDAFEHNLDRMAALLRPTGADTLATELWSATSTGRYAEAAPAAALLVVLAAVPTALLTGARARREAVAP